MIGFGAHTRVNLALGATDMRKQIDGLAVLVAEGDGRRVGAVVGARAGVADGGAGSESGGGPRGGEF